MNFIKIGFLAVSLMLCFLDAKCKDEHRPSQENVTKIRVINNSGHQFEHVTLFSMKFGDLQPNDTSEYKILNYDSLRDDPLIYAVMEGDNLGRYLRIPDKNIRHYTYVMDSVSSGILYVSSFEDSVD